MLEATSATTEQFLSVSLSQNREIRLCFRENGSGAPVLFLHEFASGAFTWNKLMPHLPSGRRWIRLDLPGFGHSSAESDSPFSIPMHAETVARFMESLDLSALTLVGHGMGGEIAVCLAGMENVRPRLKSLILISCGVLEPDIPDFIRNIGHSSMTMPIMRLVHSGFVARMLLEYAYASHHAPDAAVRGEYAAQLRDPKRVEALIAAANQFTRLPSVPALPDLPVAILAGDEDRVLSLAAAERLHARYPGSSLSFLSGCGHLPQEECPRETAMILRSVLEGQGDALPKVEPPPPVPASQRLRQLFDYWSPGTILLIVILKILQFFRRLGVHVEQQSWRKLSGIFLKREYSKFAIGVFRLPTEHGKAEEKIEHALARKLQEFMIGQPGLHWAEDRRLFFSTYKAQSFCDLMEARLGDAGEIVSISPLFDPRSAAPERKNVSLVLEAMIDIHNRNRNSDDPGRPLRIKYSLRSRLRSLPGLSSRQRAAMVRLGDRVMSASFLFFDALPAENWDERRFSTPDFRVYRHPGWGLTNIVCRFSPDHSETDLWWQFNHVMVDGAPMQDILNELKKSWGSVGSPEFPAFTGQVSHPEISDCGNGIFRTRFYADFTPLLRLRNSLNRMCLNEMNGKASFAALIMWGLSRHPDFHNRKMLLPVDIREVGGHRQLGLIIMRPGRWDRGDSPLADFCRFQAEVNRKLLETRLGYAETSELLSLGSMIHPVFYLLMQKFCPQLLEELIGTMGISIIADATVFVSPLTDFQINGFMSLGSAMISTRDGRRAGSVCVCGARHQNDLYYDAVTRLIRDLPHLLER